MSTHKPLECVNCGAPLERYSLQCEYCGTAYAAEGAQDNTVTLYADGAELAKVIKHIDVKRLELVKDPIYPLAVISAHEQRGGSGGQGGIGYIGWGGGGRGI